jgi:hypothetical protein
MRAFGLASIAKPSHTRIPVGFRIRSDFVTPPKMHFQGLQVAGSRKMLTGNDGFSICKRLVFNCKDTDYSLNAQLSCVTPHSYVRPWRKAYWVRLK